MGGQYLHYANGKISIVHISDDMYQILDLNMFYPSSGWRPVMKDGDYAHLMDELYDE